jgi:hypothetical protein
MIKFIKAVFVAGALVVALAQPVAAHNAGHVVLPSGQCIEIGSFKSVFPGPDKTAELDLIPETRLPLDEIGASFAAWQGNSPILPGPCGAS